MRHSALFAIILLGLFGQPVLAAPLAPANVPEPLKPWVDWVLRDQPSQDCPYQIGSQIRQCQWPSSLQLALSARGGRFVLLSHSYSAGQTLMLPGDQQYWPQDVTVDGQPATVISQDQRPAISLSAGEHRIGGLFIWDRLPDSLSVPPAVGLVSLERDGKPQAFPQLNEAGQLILAGAAAGGLTDDASDSLTIKVYRRLQDGVPFQVTTHLDLEVSGKPRAIALSGLLLEGAIPMSIISSLPARLEQNRLLNLQLRPGRWTAELAARFPGEVTALKMPTPVDPMPPEEIWVYEAQPALRLAEVVGVSSVDPRQTTLPDDWRQLPAYRMDGGASLGLRVIRRGDPEPEPDPLSLQRTLWLDFDGGGYSVHDRIGGRVSRSWRLNADPAMTLGRVSIDDAPQSITVDDSGASGVELRRGALALSAESRLGAGTSLSASGWRRDFQHLSVELNLPPGWRLFAATGADAADGTWVGRWTLLDFFIVLTITLAVARLGHWRLAAFTLLTLMLIWHEPAAPRYLWLHLLAAVALLRVLPEGRMAGWIRAYRRLSLLLLLLIAIPFAVDQLRLGLHPQLEHDDVPQHALNATAGEPRPTPATALAPRDLESQERAEDAAGGAAPGLKRAMPYRMMTPAPASLSADPAAITQTGPGMPRWTWNSVRLTWQGPVREGQTLRVILLPPVVNLALRVLAVLCLSGLGALLAGSALIRGKPGGGPPAGQWLLGLLVVLVGPPPANAADLPGPELLGELQHRLLATPDCLPDGCADIPRLTLNTSPGQLQLSLEVNVAAQVSLPLPALAGLWLPTQVDVDGQAAAAVMRSRDGQLWLALSPGHHKVALSGALPAVAQLQLPLPLRPHRVDVTGTGWRVEGIGENGIPDVQIQLLREGVGDQGAASTPLQESSLPPFLALERQLTLGLEWHVRNQIHRLTPADTPLSLEIPLLEGESVLSADVPVRAGRVSIRLPAGQSDLQWDSRLAQHPTLRLQAGSDPTYSELWRLNASPIWHVHHEGIAPIHPQADSDVWQPEWRPWPGESVSLTITRPSGAPGNTLTVDASSLDIRPGERAQDITLQLMLRSSQGQQQSVRLPANARLQSVTIDGVEQPIRLHAGTLVLPIHPGHQQATLRWISDEGQGTLLRSPEVVLDRSSVNATSHIHLGPDRWVLLLGGPLLGPVVLFWSVLLAIALLAYGLARIPGSPARGWQWALLLIGLSQASLVGAMLVTGWLLALSWRGRSALNHSHRVHNGGQVVLALLTLAALAQLADAVAAGLLGRPDMQISGNGSDAGNLYWYQDHSPSTLPRPWVISAPLWIYRGLMLVWALWLANRLLDWLRWGWGCFTRGGIWRKKDGKQDTVTSQGIGPS
jgi:hypothetical protein